MKKILALSFVAVLFAGIIGLSSCKKDVVVTVNIADQAVCLPATGTQSTLGKVDVFEILIGLLKDEFTQQGLTFSTDRIKSAKFKNFKVVVTTTAANFDEVAGMSVYVKPPSNTTTDGDQIAYIDNIGTGVAEVTLNLNGLELKPLLSNEKMIVTIRTFNKAGGNADVCMKLTSGVIEIEAQK